MAKRFITFAITFVALFVLTYAFMAIVDALPDPIVSSSQTPQQEVQGLASQSSQPDHLADGSATGELPVRVVAKKVGLDVSISNTQSTDVETLDNLLLKGAVRYPTSALLGAQGTVLLFGHSSYLPIVRNQNFKAFNGIQKLKVGDTVSVYSAGAEYRYTVTGVRLANATEDVVELPANGQHLSLVTCDSFGTKSDRWIVTADFAGAYAL